MPVNRKLELITALTTAIANCSLYSPEHAIVRSLSEKVTGIITELMGEEESTDIMIVENEIVFSREPLKEQSIHVGNFIKRLRRKGIDKVIFKKGLSVDEVIRFIGDMADPQGVVARYPHISTGIIEVRLGVEGGMGLSESELDRFRNEQVGRIRESFSGVSRFKKLDVTGLEDIVINFISAFQQEVNILNIMTPFKSYTEFTYTHAANVAILTIFQAEALGIKGEYLHDIGIAALLHDVGKMFVPNEILEKKGKLDKKEWEEMQKHTMYGAKYLMTMDNIPKIAVPAALEHHLRYDGKGYPRTGTMKLKQHLCSQLVAIADFFDALRAKRPYKRDFEVVEILALIREGTGTTFNPFIANSFIRNLSKTIKVEE